MRGLEGKVALVTGAASGIGKAIAERLAEEGAAVLATDIQDEAGEAVAAGIRERDGKAVYAHQDVSSEDEWAATVQRATEEFDRLDVLVNNAGIGDLAAIEETTKADYDRTIAVTQTSVFLGMKHAAEALKTDGGGSVVNISSIFGASGGFGASPAYHAAKGAVRLLTKNVALRWATEGVRVNSVHPGFVETPIIEQALGTPVEEAMIATTPMGRLAQPEEIAGIVAFLAERRRVLHDRLGGLRGRRLHGAIAPREAIPARIFRLREQEERDRDHPESRAGRRQREREPVVERRVLPAHERRVDCASAHVGEDDERDADDPEAGAQEDERQFRPVGESRHELPGGERHREGGERAPPPGEIRPLGREPRPPPPGRRGVRSRRG